MRVTWRHSDLSMQEKATEVKANVRGRHQLAYKIKDHWEGIFVLFSYICTPSTVPKVEKLLSKPSTGQEAEILRHMTLRYS